MKIKIEKGILIKGKEFTLSAETREIIHAMTIMDVMDSFLIEPKRRQIVQSKKEKFPNKKFHMEKEGNFVRVFRVK